MAFINPPRAPCSPAFNIAKAGMIVINIPANK